MGQDTLLLLGLDNIMKYLILLLLFFPAQVKAITWKEFWQPFTDNGPREYIYYTPMCVKVVYREQYIPGNAWQPGYVRHWREKIKVPCSQRY
jgi:hypothetical protein